MNKIQHPSNNHVLGAPKDWDQSKLRCEALAVTVHEDDPNNPAICSFWKPTPEELQQLNNGEHVCLWIFGRSMPPVALTVMP